jgi:hypothetical protein
MIKKLDEFISKHRNKFENRDNNRFAFSFSSITRYSQFLQIILERYTQASSRYVQNIQQIQRSLRDDKSGTVNQEQSKLLEDGRILYIYLHLEIESFYLFAKILLDRAARSIELYFGTARGLALDSHDDLVKRIERYCTIKKIALPKDFLSKIIELKREINDFRDYEITHEKSPRTIRGTSFNTDGKTRLTLNVIYPTEKELKEKKYQRESAFIDDLRIKIDEYLDSLVDFIETNADKTVLSKE